MTMGKNILTEADFRERIRILENEIYRRGKEIDYTGKYLIIVSSILMFAVSCLMFAAPDASRGIKRFIFIAVMYSALLFLLSLTKRKKLRLVLFFPIGILAFLFTMLSAAGFIADNIKRHREPGTIWLALPILIFLCWAFVFGAIKLYSVFPSSNISRKFVKFFGILSFSILLPISILIGIILIICGGLNGIVFSIWPENEAAMFVFFTVAVFSLFLMNIFAVAAVQKYGSILGFKILPDKSLKGAVSFGIIFMVAMALIVFLGLFPFVLLSIIHLSFPEPFVILFAGAIFFLFFLPFAIAALYYSFFGTLILRKWRKNAEIEISRMKQEIDDTK